MNYSPSEFLELTKPEREAYLATLSEDKRESFLLEVKKESDEREWLDALINQTDEHANAISKVMNCPVIPFVFVIEPMKDAAVGFFRKPDAKQSFKIFRSMSEGSYETGLEMLAKAQLVRDADLVSRDFKGSASDSRFMDANGNYDPQYSDLNFNLLTRASKLISIFKDEFKKK